MSNNPFLSFGSKSNSVANNFSNSLKYNSFTLNNNNKSFNSIQNFTTKPTFNTFLSNNNNNTNTNNNNLNNDKSNPFSFLSKNNNASQNYNPFIKNNFDNNNKNDNTNNFLNFSFSKNENSNNTNNNNPFSVNKNNGNDNLSKNIFNQFTNNNNKTSNINPFQTLNNNNINTNNFQTSNPFNLNNNNNNKNIFSNFPNNNSNNIFNLNKSNNNNIFNNNIFNSNNIFNNNGFNQNNIFSSNNNNINNNMFLNNTNTPFLISYNESMVDFKIYNSNLNTNIIFEPKQIKKEDNILTKSVPLSKILNNHFNKQDYDDNAKNLEIFKEEENYFNNDYNYKLYNYKEEFNNYKKKRKDEEKQRKYKLEKEKEYLNDIKKLYEKNNKEKLKELMHKNNNKNRNNISISNKDIKESKKEEEKEASNINNNEKIKIKEKEQIILINNDNNNKKLNKELNNINKIEIKKENKSNNNELNKKEKIIDDNNFIYELILIILNENNEEIYKQIISVDKSQNYELNLDYIFSLSSSILNKKKIKYKYGLSFKIGYLDLEEKTGTINLLNYDILSEMYKKDKNNIIKRLNLEVNIIKGDIFSEEDLCINPQLFCKLTKEYGITPSINIINKYNLFRYDKGIKIDMKYISIIFNENKKYDLTFVNFDEFTYNEDTEIFFDKNDFEKENSTLLKLGEEEITLIYKGINSLYKENLKNIIIKYLSKRYKNEKCKYIDSNIIIRTKIKNLLISEEQSKIFYEEFKKNIIDK